MKRAMSAVLVLEAATFEVAASLHYGRWNKAALPEAIIGGILVLGAVGAFRGSWRAALTATALSIVGVSIGVATIVAGIGPQTAPDVTYHVVILSVLLGSMVALLRPDTRTRWKQTHS
jgi:hypothetical protein